MEQHLPVSTGDMKRRRWAELDFVLITGDAYVDHPSFGASVISRILESRGYRIGIIAQPDWRSSEDFRKLGRPRLAFLITAGNLDSMVNHFSVSKHRRKRDVYSPGGATGRRPDRAALVYASCARSAFKGVPVILGGLEASLRRLSHYDYWSDKIRRSVLADSKADLIVYGMGERQVIELADLLERGTPVSEIRSVRGTVYHASSLRHLEGSDFVMLPSFDKIREDRTSYARGFMAQYHNTDPISGKTLVEPSGDGFIVQNPPALPLSQEEMDEVYDLPYTCAAHPDYNSVGGVPALEEVQFSLLSSRGCFGNCSFCALAYHQGRVVQSRSHGSLLEEAKRMTLRAGFKGYIHDVGGPTANFRHPPCSMQLSRGSCTDRQCLYPKPCRNLSV
ncbi:MAG TPA: YgiQ family radical SAM protein, partial [Spirochaetia bacterium]|nr:YgiQ family radical SAM protein [Spirochaetia bacterium]